VARYLPWRRTLFSSERDLVAAPLVTNQKLKLELKVISRRELDRAQSFCQVAARRELAAS
jgi:hypothetical protein